MSVKSVLVAGAVAGMFAMGAANVAHAADAAKVKCEGGNSCKGMSACKTAKNECKGHNACNGQGFTEAKDQKECDAMKDAAKKAKEGSQKK